MFNDILDKKVFEITKIIEAYMPPIQGPQEEIMKAMHYSIMGGGKRIRSLLMFESYKAFGGRSKAIEPFLVAIECIHNYSLVHDDLPDMDNDDYRRGRLTTHKVYGNGMAILAGDALLNYAFELTSKAILDHEEHYREMIRGIQLLSNKAGIYGMIGGQVVDISSEGRDIPIELIEFIHIHKTSALIEAAMGIGAILAGADSKDESIFIQAARKIGLAFQIQDDILDVEGSFDNLGKPVHSDEKNEKMTFIQKVGLKEAKESVERLSMESIALIQGLKIESKFLEELVQSLIYRNK